MIERLVFGLAYLTVGVFAFALPLASSAIIDMMISLGGTAVKYDLFHLILAEHMQYLLLVLDMFDPLRLINCIFGNYF